MVACGYCSGLGEVLLLGMPGPICCPLCHGSGKVLEEVKEETTHQGMKRISEELIIIFLLFLGTAIGSVYILFFIIL